MRAFKIPEMEDREEDYGEEAFYLGTLEDHPDSLSFSNTITFKRGEPKKISRNLALILSKSRLAQHFEISEI